MGIFSVVPPTEPCALRSTQPLKVSTRDFSWGKGSWCIWLTTYHSFSAKTSRKSRALTYPEPLGQPRPVVGDLYLDKFKHSFNPSPVQFKALLHGQKGCVFFSGHLNLRTAPETGLPSREKNHNN